MDIKLPIKIHNKFDIEVKDIITGEVVQRGYAENIVLDNIKTANLFVSSAAYIGSNISYGTGTGVLSPSRTTLFNHLGQEATSSVEMIVNQPPLASYGTKKAVIAPGKHTGETITEVGISGNTTTIFTHALIKDSEGNQIALGPIEPTHEITIYRTVYLVPVCDEGISFLAGSNGLINGLLLYTTSLLQSVNPNNRISVNGSTVMSSTVWGYVNSVATFNHKFLTSVGNTKIKTMDFGAPNTGYASLAINLETLAENNSTIWSGHEFDKTLIGTGDGSQIVFNLTWDEAWLTKPYAVYVDNILQSSGVTFNAGNITFDVAPADQAVISADYWVKYIPKDTNHELWINIEISITDGGV